MIDSWLKKIEKEGKPDEWEVKKLLTSIGIKVPEGFVIDPQEVIPSVQLNYPVVVKVCDSAILHKTEVGGVALNVFEENYKEAVKKMQAKFPQSRIMVEEMSSYSGMEFILGGLVDPTFGKAIMIGAGGILTELYKDVTFRLVPLEKEEALRMLKELTVSPVLQGGYRGSQMDIDELAEIIVSVGDLITKLGPHFSQLDINPLVYTKEGWKALDGMLVLN
ncbi:MAG: acetyl-CoA synthetase [Spirochaetes bacterium]|nr:MAG: acetyl-CoA synthetase [Spirochaetota bacterium]